MSTRSQVGHSPHASTPAPRLSAWTVLAVTTGVQVLISGAALTPPVFATEAAADIGVDARFIGIYSSLVYFGAMLTSLPSGGIVGRFGALRVMQVCLTLGGAGLMALAGAHPLLALSGALVIGLGYGPVTPASSHILAQSTPPHRRALVFSLKQTGVPLGGFVAGAVVPTVVLWIGWQGASLAVAGAALALALAVQPARAALDADRRSGQTLRLGALVAPLGVVWRSRSLRLMALSSFSFAAVQLSLSTFMVVYLVETVGLSLVAAGLIMAAAQVGGVIGRVVWGFLADRLLGARWMLVLLAFGMASAAVITTLFSAEWPLLAISGVSVFFGATAIGWNGVYLAEIAHLAPKGEAGPATGGALFFTYAGVVAGPALFGVLAGLPGGYGLAFAVYAGMAAAGGLLVLGTRAPDVEQ